MTRAPRAAACAAAFATLALGACSSAEAPGPDSAATPTSPSTTDAAAGPSASPSPTAVPKPGSTEVPATRSGPLTQDSFPRPGELGAHWSYAVPTGDAEEGYVGNGTPALARDPEEVALAAVPLGCPRADLPLPEAVLEVDYTVAGRPVISLRAAFDTPREAEAFASARADALRACRGRTGSAAIGPLVGGVRTQPTTSVLRSVRTPASDPWTELAAVDGDQVVLVALRGRPGPPPLTPDQLDSTAAAFTGR